MMAYMRYAGRLPRDGRRRLPVRAGRCRQCNRRGPEWAMALWRGVVVCAGCAGLPLAPLPLTWTEMDAWGRCDVVVR